MDRVPWEVVLKILIDIRKDVVDLIKSWVKLSKGNSSVPDGISTENHVMNCGVQRQRASMRRRVNFRNDFNTSNKGIIDNFLNILFRVNFHGRESTIFAEIRSRGEIDRERVTIGNVPMQDVKLNTEHGVHNLEELFLGDEMSGGIDHDSSVRESGTIDDIDRSGLDTERRGGTSPGDSQ